MGNAVTNLLLHGFSRYEKGECSLEEARDDARHLISRVRNGAPFGNNTSIENVCSHLLTSNRVVLERYYICPNGHHVHHSNDYNAFLVCGNEYESIAQWVATASVHTNARCQTCAHAVSIKLRFLDCPPLLAFCFHGFTLHVDSTITLSVGSHDCMYSLLAVVYYADQHFTAQIITRDGRIWYYDGLALTNQHIQPTLKYVGSMLCRPDLLTCGGGRASAAIYARL